MVIDPVPSNAAQISRDGMKIHTYIMFLDDVMHNIDMKIEYCLSDTTLGCYPQAQTPNMFWIQIEG